MQLKLTPSAARTLKLPLALSEVVDLPPVLVRPEAARQPYTPGAMDTEQSLPLFAGQETAAGPVILLSGPVQLAKRLVDLMGALAGLVLCSPFLLLLALLIPLESPGPAFYGQWRVGRAGRPFRLWKFRTMLAGGQDLLDHALQADPLLRQEWECYHKLRCDPRVTLLGRFLRRYSLDELPQLWNVLIGEMSLVGPRPYLPGQADLYQLASTGQGYFLLRPGLTGLWQVSGRNRLSFAERAHLDDVYLQYWSPRLERWILAHTLWAVLGGEGAF